jgi:indolepyruvate decarboxylase
MLLVSCLIVSYYGVHIYGVGELSAINSIAGAYAEHVPVFHLVGMPNMTVQAGHMLVHHTLGNGEFDFFRKMADPVVCARVGR